jgi:hypothetical protein
LYYGPGFSLDILLEFEPFYYVPIEVQFNIYRWINNGIAPQTDVLLNTYYDLASVTTTWTENLEVTDTSLTEWLMDPKNNNFYPDQASWALSDNSAIVDPIWSGSAFDWINNLLGDPWNFEASYEGSYGTYSLPI